MGVEIPPRFDPALVEGRWQAHWASERCFEPSASERPVFSMVLPPPNVTGVLTLGHMLGDTVMDVLARWHRMRGEEVLWIPGIDHAGLATQVAVRRHLAKEGVRLESLPRDEVLRRIESWKAERESTILAQTKAGGFSLAWSKYRYTMDPGSVRATREAFVALHRDGLVYRGERIVNWDPRLETAVSDLEVVHREEPAELLYLTYPWADGSPGGIVVATVRPETIFGDVAVAVHPNDERHGAAIGRSVRVPLTDRAVPVISDAAIDPAFGNGALKVTPRHDLLDFEIAKRHPELATPIEILSPSAHLEGAAVPEAFRGLDRDRARRAVTDALEAAGSIARREAYQHSVARSERTDAVIEPRLSRQWFVKVSALAGPAVEAVRSGTIRIHPERWTLTYHRWMETLQDWCISRQVAWGHAIPVYYCDACGGEFASVDPPTRCERCSSPRLTQDPDVLDTWFSSWLWPFVTLGWPDQTADLARFYPGSVLVTGRDILFFWVARMIMAGYRFTGRPPFRDVYFTGMLRDDLGRRMSKHLGNSPDPLELIRERGADALRFALVHPNPTDQDGPFGVGTLDGGRNFLTKVWNLGRLALARLPDGMGPPTRPPILGSDASLEDRWILSRWRSLSTEVETALHDFEFTRAATALHGFLWHDLADRYVEIAKEALSGHLGESARRESAEVLLFVLERTLRLLHPFVPHVTEELWHALPHEGPTLALAPWPTIEGLQADPAAEATIEILWEAVRTLRSLKAEQGAESASVPVAYARPATSGVRAILAEHAETVQRLARIGALDLLGEGTAAPAASVGSVSAIAEFFLPRSEGHGDGGSTLKKEREKLTELLERTRGRLSDPGFRSRAPAHVVVEAEEKAVELTERIRKIDANLGREAGEVPP